MRSPIFVSGMGRSGTTLLEKLLHNHPALTILSQPAPMLYVDLKRRFLTERGCEPGPNPLGNYFHEPCAYTYVDFVDYLCRHQIGDRDMEGLWQDSAGYSGQYHEIDDPAIFDNLTGPVASTLLRFLTRLSRNDDTTVGCKETHCEEFWPYLLGEGWRGVGIVRDPRDVITSFSFGHGQIAGGRLRPTLFHVRNWRKSIAFMIELSSHPGFHWLRYEDLITDPVSTLEALGTTLGVEGLSQVAHQPVLVNQQGQPWLGNSSFSPRAGVDGSASGSYRDLLPDEAATFIEACCGPEMRWAGFDYDDLDTEAAISSFVEPFRIVRPEFTPNFSSDPVHVAQELARLDDLRHGEPPAHWSPPFLSSTVYEALRRSWT